MRRKEDRLQKYTPKYREYTYFAFDIEYTREEGALIEACIGNEQEQHFYQTWDDILKALFKLSRTHKSTRFIVHAGDIAEYNHLIQYIMLHKRDEYDVYPTMSGETIVALDIRRNRQSVKFLDMFALFPMSLDKISKTFAPDYPKLAGAVDFSKRDYDPLTDRPYLQRDVQATCASYRNICALIWKHFGVQPSMTAAGTAMRAWRASLPEDVQYFRLSPINETFCREAYYGAYVHPGYDNKLHTNVASYDVTAAYGARMRDKRYPVGTPLYSTTYTADYQGIWNCTVTAINPLLPIVPYRKEKEGVFWLGVPGDVCTTTVTMEEIEYFKQHGYAVVVHFGVYWLKSEYIFRDFMFKVEAVESLDAITKQCAKLMRNSLYGRFGMKARHEKVVITNDPTEECMPYSHPDTGELLENVYTVQEEIDAPYLQPHWAGYITAYQRLAMFDLVFQCGVEHCYGVDTDSIKTDLHIIAEKNLPLSETEYGKGKIEAFFTEYRSHGPKNYVGKQEDLKLLIKSKGIPKKALTDEIIITHLYRTSKTDPIKVYFKSITKALTMIKSDGRLPFTQERHRTLSSLHSTKWQLKKGRFYTVKNTA